MFVVYLCFSLIIDQERRLATKKSIFRTKKPLVFTIPALLLAGLSGKQTPSPDTGARPRASGPLSDHVDRSNMRHRDSGQPQFYFVISEDTLETKIIKTARKQEKKKNSTLGDYTSYSGADLLVSPAPCRGLRLLVEPPGAVDLNISTSLFYTWISCFLWSISRSTILCSFSCFL